MYAGSPPPQVGRSREELRSSERDEEHGNLAHPRGERLEQVELARVGPVDVLEQEHRRATQRERLHEDAGREEDRVAVRARPLPVQTEQHLELRSVLLGRGGAGDLGDGARELGARLSRVVAVEDGGDLLDHLRERAVRRARPVRRRASSHDAPTLASDELRELEPEAGLSDPGGAEDGYELRPILADDARPERGEDVELAVAADHRYRRHRPLARGRGRAQREPGTYRCALALGENGLGGPVLDRVARGRVRLLPHQNRSHRRCGLESSCGVHDVSGDHGLAVARTRFELDDRFPGVDGDPHLEPVLLRPVAHGECGAHGALGIVAVRSRRAEDPHHRVADELLHGAAVPLELFADALVVGRENCAHVLGIERLGLPCEADEVDEEDRDDASLLADLARPCQSLAARVAELRSVGILLFAARAGRHGPED